jgi:hypothetical protein
MIPAHFTRYITLPALLLLQGFYAAAQNVVFTASANRSKAGLEDQIELAYTIRDAENLQTMGPGKFKDFQVVGGPYKHQSSNINIVGNRATQSSSITITYILQPLRTGNLQIQPCIAKDAEGRSFQSNPVNIQVVPGRLDPPVQQQAQGNNPNDPWNDDPFAALMRQQLQAQQHYRQQQQQLMRQQQQQQQQQPQGKQQAAPTAKADLSKDLFIKVTVDKPSIRVGEQTTATYKLYSRIPMQVGISKLPSLNGFWTQDFDLPKQQVPQEEILDGKKYQVFVLKKSALFPQQAGKLILDPAEAQGTARVVQQVRQRNPFADMFDDPAFRQMMGGSLSMNDPFFNDDMFSSMAYQDIPVHLKSQPITVTVTDLPAKDAPADYGGAVGNFTINAKMDKASLTTDEAATLTFTINGSGNLKLIQSPKLSLPNGLDTYDPQVIDTITGRSTTISGAKIITYSITPRTPGDYTIPSIPFTYFNPQTGTYTTLQTKPLKLSVTAGKNYSAPVAKANPNLKDIHNIVLQAPLSFAAVSQKPLLFTAGYWSLYALPLLALLGVAFWKRREDELHSNTALLKNKRANKIALKRLVTAKQLLQQGKQQPFYEEVSKAIWLYLSDKLSIPLSALSKEMATEALTAKNVPYALQQSTSSVMEDCELALYASSGGRQQMQQTYDEAIAIISKLEDYLHR